MKLFFEGEGLSWNWNKPRQHTQNVVSSQTVNKTAFRFQKAYQINGLGSRQGEKKKKRNKNHLAAAEGHNKTDLK